MRVIVAAIAEHAWEENGSLSICKMFDTINCPGFPFSLPRISIAVRMLFEDSEAGVHSLKIVLSDHEGIQIVTADGEINLAVSPNAGPREYSIPFVLNGQNVNFQHSGTYTVDIIIDGCNEQCVPLYVMATSSKKGSLN